MVDKTSTTRDWT